MTVNRDELAQDAMNIARWIAKRRFAGNRDWHELIVDAVHYAWEFAQTANAKATPLTVARVAVRRVGSVRRFSGSTKSIEHPRRREHHQQVCLTLELADYSRAGDNPANIAALRIDLAAWLATLSPRLRTLVHRFANGYQTQEIAKRMKISPGRVSQLREELRNSWREFISE